MRTILPFLLLLLLLLCVFRGENSFYVRFLETDSRNLLKRRRERNLGRILSPAALIDVTRKSHRNLKSAFGGGGNVQVREVQLAFAAVISRGEPALHAFIRQGERVLSGPQRRRMTLLSTSRGHARRTL